MSLGSLYLKFKQKYGHGLEVAHYRDRVRPKILQTEPITNTTDKTCELHVLTSAHDYLNLIWALKSFYYYSGRQYTLCIHGDKSLTESYQTSLKEHFPQARVIDWNEAESIILQWLANYPRCQNLRQSRFISAKEFDFLYYLESEKMLLFDSDILFFSKPTELIARIENDNYRLNAVNKDIDTAYSIPTTLVKEKLGFDMIDNFNSGLGLIHRASLHLDWFEEFLQLPGILDHFWRFEQTLMALASSRFGVELLPSEYDVRFNKGINNCPSRHYVGAIRHLMYGEGMKQLVKQGFLKSLS